MKMLWTSLNFPEPMATSLCAYLFRLGKEDQSHGKILFRRSLVILEFSLGSDNRLAFMTKVVQLVAKEDRDCIK